MKGAYLGPSFDEKNILRTIRRFSALAEVPDSFRALSKKTAELIAKGMVVGWFQGRMEFGPRALGNRSILGDARSPLVDPHAHLVGTFARLDDLEVDLRHLGAEGGEIDNSQLSRYEKGICYPSFDKLRVLASVFNVSIQSFSDVVDLESFEQFKPAEGGAEDIDRAVAAARRAYEEVWSGTPPAKRARILQRTGELILEHRDELNRLIGLVERKGFTLVPTAMYWKRGRAKLEIGLAKGKKLHDKRADEKERDWQREKQRIFKTG